jgi:cobalamin biosynthesis Mg chelatase CobN
MDESQTTSATTGDENETAAAPVASQEPDTADGAPDGDGNSVANLPTTPTAASPPAAAAGNSTWSWPVFLAPIVVAAVLVILLMVIFRGQRGRAAT